MDDHFTRLGLPKKYDLDPQQIEDSYLSQSRQLHPDYHQQGSSSEQQVSIEMTAALNEAYSTLRDPFRRAEYLLSIEGGPSAADSIAMSQAFLEETLELRMEIEMLQQSNDSTGLDEMEQQLLQQKKELLNQVAGQFEKYQSQKQPEILVQIREQLNAIKFVQGLIRDLHTD